MSSYFMKHSLSLMISFTYYTYTLEEGTGRGGGGGLNETKILIIYLTYIKEICNSTHMSKDLIIKADTIHGRNFEVIFIHYKHIVFNKTIFFHYQLLQEDEEGPVGP